MYNEETIITWGCADIYKSKKNKQAVLHGTHGVFKQLYERWEKKHRNQNKNQSLF